MPEREDNFRVEVWNDEKSTLVETVSRSPDFLVSMAAWHAAIRRRPGVRLIHMNADRVMDDMITPGERNSPSVIVNGKRLDNFDATLGDLRHWHAITAYCTSCTNRKTLDIARLKARFGAGVTFTTLETMLRCQNCVTPDVRIEVHKAGRG